MDRVFTEYKEILNKTPRDYKQDFAKTYEQLEDSHAYYQGQVIPFLYQPFFFSQEEENFLAEVTKKLSTILEKVIQKYLNDKEFRSYFGFSKELEELILVNPGYENNFPMARFDIFYYGLKNLKFCELNADGSSGLVKSNILDDHFMQAEAVKELQKKYELENWELIDSWLETMFNAYQQFADTEVRPNIAIMDFNNYGMVGEFKHFKELLTERGYNVKIVDPRELEYKDNNLYSEDFKIDLIYRRAVTTDLMAHYHQLDDLWQAYKNQDVCLVGPIRSQIIHNKIIFAILHDQAKVPFLSAAEREFIANYIPRTELVKSQNEEQLAEVRAKRKQFVLKPMDDYGANGVVVGTDLSQTEWEQEVNRIWQQGQNYLVQEFCSLPEKELATFDNNNQLDYQSYKYILGLFAYSQEFQGIYNRAAQQNVIASSTGCVTLANFKVQEN